MTKQEDAYGTVTPYLADRMKIGEDLVLGVTDANGGMWTINSIDKWENIDLDGGVSRLAWADGAYYHRQWVAPLSFDVTLTIAAPPGDKEGLAARLSFLKECLPIRHPTLIAIDALGQRLAVEARVEDAIQVTRATSSAQAATVKIPFTAADPRRFATNAGLEVAWKTLATGLPKSSGGFTLPFTLPLVIEGQATSGVLDFTVNGTRPAKTRYTITGPITTPSVQDETTGARFTINTILNPGETLVVDADLRTVTVNNTQSRRGAFTGNFMQLTPGRHEITFTHSGQTASPDAMLEISYLEAS